MDEDFTIVNQNTRNESITSFLKKNLKKIVLILFSLIIFLIFLFVSQELKDRKKNRLAEKYNNIIFSKNISSNSEIKDKMIEIVNAKDQTYSTLALYYIIDNKLLDNQIKINEFFDTIISISKNENKFLIVYKKALYNSDKISDNEVLAILQPVINSDSIWKQHALLLMADIYFQIKQFNKSRDFLNKILDLESSNKNLKQEVEKRLNRDFSE
tara:strand:- start:82 stop:720 length:639 start_codon:yes stop_codon:yes gene_type:complete